MVVITGAIRRAKLQSKCVLIPNKKNQSIHGSVSPAHVKVYPSEIFG